MSAELLGIFAKEPTRGQAKTRLAQATSESFAQRVASALLEDSLDRFSTVPCERVIVYSPFESATYFSTLAQHRYACLPQCAGNLGARLQHFVQTARCKGHARIVVLGSDSPTLPFAYVEQAFTALMTNDVVIGPAFDGGYYLIGCGLKELPLFEAIPWSTSKVLQATVDRCRKASAALALLPPWYDVDTVDDWAMLRGHVLAMRHAGLDPGVPRLEALLAETMR